MRQAGGMAARHLVDYELLSNLQKTLRIVAPFGTFRGGIPGAVMGGIARSPMRAALYSRLTGGTMYGDKPGGSEGFYMLNPTAEVGRGLSWGTDDSGEMASFQNSGPMGYVTSTLGIPGSLAEQFMQSPHPAYGNKYGEPWMPELNGDGTWNIGILANEALAGVPEAQTALNAMGIGQFQWRGLAAEAARQNAGLMLPESQIPQ
jgi:hypothetical protein